MTEAIAATQINRLSQLTRGLPDSALRELVQAYWRFCQSEAHANRVTEEILRSWTSDKYPPTPADIREIAESSVTSGERPKRPRGCNRCDYCGLVLNWYLCTKGERGEPDTRGLLTPERAKQFRDENYEGLRRSVGTQGVYQMSDYCDCALGVYLVAQRETRRLLEHEHATQQPKARKGGLERVR